MARRGAARRDGAASLCNRRSPRRNAEAPAPSEYAGVSACVSISRVFNSGPRATARFAPSFVSRRTLLNARNHPYEYIGRDYADLSHGRPKARAKYGHVRDSEGTVFPFLHPSLFRQYVYKCDHVIPLSRDRNLHRKAREKFRVVDREENRAEDLSTGWHTSVTLRAEQMCPDPRAQIFYGTRIFPRNDDRNFL